MISVILAAIVSASLYFSMQGFIAGTYVIFGFLVLNMTLVIYASGVHLGLRNFVEKNSEKYSSVDKDISKIANNLLVRLLLIACAYHIYLSGYVFFAGMSMTALAITILATIFEYLDSRLDT